MHRPQGKNLPSQLCNHYEIDNVYCQTSSHMKDSVRQCIEKRGYVNLAKLLSRKHSSFESDERLEIVNKNGKMYFLLASENEPIKINNCKKWEEAFGIYASIFTKTNPHHTIFQHIDNIKGATKDFTWESIAEYDDKFRELMGTFPLRNWGIIYSQAWMKTLKPKWYSGSNHSGHSSNNSGSAQKKGKLELCWKFN